MLPGLKKEILFVLTALPEIILDQRTLWKQLSPFHSLPYERIATAVHRGCEEGLLKRTLRNGHPTLHVTEQGKAEIPLQLDLKKLKKPKWDGSWRLLSFDVPERNRRTRNLLRKKLRALGYGMLHQSLWLTPHDLFGETHQFAARHGLRACVWLFKAHLAEGNIPDEVVKAAWPHLPAINKAYHSYVDRWSKLLDALLPDTDQLSLRASKALARFQLAAILSKDPQLPKPLLQYSWGMNKALACYKRVCARTRRR